MAGAASSLLRAEVVERDDGFKLPFIVAPGSAPVTRVPINLAKARAVLPQLDIECSACSPVKTEPVLLIVFELYQSEVGAAIYAMNSILLSILPPSFPLAFTVRPFLNLSGRVNHFVPFLASLKRVKGNFFAPVVSHEGLRILTLLVRVPVVIRLFWVKQLDDFLLLGSPYFFR